MKTLIFVYNANSGMVNSWVDMAHKILKPSTYECHLCILTHGSFREKRRWKNFKNNLTTPLEFYHKDEFLNKFESKWLPKFNYPVILSSDGVTLETLVSASDIEKINSVEELIEKIEKLTQ